MANEVSSMVDIISFAVADTTSEPSRPSNIPSFDITPTPTPAPQQQSSTPQPVSNLASLASLQTGYQSQPSQFTPQATGFTPQATGFQPQATGFQQQATGLGSNLGGNFQRPPMPPIPPQFSSNLSPSGPLQAQPTGIPGQWGFVNAPAGGLPGIDALSQRMMPQIGHQGGFTSSGLTGNAKIPWAITKDEKKIYDGIFQAWDGLNKGYVTGDQALQVFGQSGLEKTDLEKIWTLSDPGNKGRLDKDEFAVAIHLIYRKLNGHDVPMRLPPELIPPSTRTFNQSLSQVKSYLQSDAEVRKTSGAALLPQATGVSYMKNHSFRGNSTPAAQRKDATVYKNNDDAVGYKSSARHRAGRTPSPQPPTANDDLSIEQLRKKIREKEILLDAVDIKDQDRSEDDEVLDRRDRRDADDLYRRIRRVQEDIDSHPNASSRSVDSEAEKRALKRQMQNMMDRLPDLASRLRKTERGIMEAKLELFRLRDAKANPSTAPNIIGTGPGGAITESDRLKARSRAKMQARLAELTGKPAPSGSGSGAGDEEDAARRLAEESNRARDEKEKSERIIKDIEESAEELRVTVTDSLHETGSGSQTSSSEHEKRRWEEGLGVEEEIRDFIFDLERSSKNARASNREPTRSATPKYSMEEPVRRVERSPPRSSTPTARSAGTSSGQQAGETRAAYIKRQAEERMASRLAALGIQPASKSGSATPETTQQRIEREKQEKQERLRKAEEEDAKREQQRQKRIADETISPPVVENKKPPPPAPRGVKKDKSSSDAQADGAARRKTEEDATRKEEEDLLRNEQEDQEAKRMVLEYVYTLR